MAVKEGYNKACRYSKLHLWNLTEYQKVVIIINIKKGNEKFSMRMIFLRFFSPALIVGIVYSHDIIIIIYQHVTYIDTKKTNKQKVVFLDADTLVVQEIDELFQRPQFSGAIDAGRKEFYGWKKKGRIIRGKII